MSMDGVYLSKVLSYCFLGDVDFEVTLPNPILGVEVAHCSINEVRGVVQLLQFKFIGIPDSNRSTRLDECWQVFIG